MSLLEQASLVITPNAVKESKLYSVVPSDGSGDMDVVRATTATRVNSEGLIEVVPRNLAQYSEQFDNVYWGKTAGTTVTANTTISPNGTSTADTVAFASSADSINKFISTGISVVNGTTYTFSLYTKTPTQIIYFGGATGGSGTNVFNGSIDVGNGWYRQSITRTWSASGTINIQNIILLGASGSVFIWGAQLDQGSTATEYFPTTDRLNIPRIDYTNGSCPSILVEPQRTNLAKYSEQFDNSDWVKVATTVSANATIAPDGTLTADKLITTSANSSHIIYQTIGSIGDVRTLSCYVKKIDYRYVTIQYGTASCRFDFDTLTFTGGTNNGYEALPNGWYRIYTTLTATINARFNIFIPNNSGNISYIGDNTSGTFIWGAQLEAGSYATSYIPTVASTITRNQDVISKTGISGLIGQTEGTIVLDFELQPNNINGNYLFSLSDGTSSNLIRSEIYILSPTVSQFRTGLTTSGVGQGDNFTTITQLRNKMAISYSLNDFKLFINGVLVYTDTTATIPATSGFHLGNRIGLGNIIGANYKKAILFKTALTDQECINLTTL